MKIVIIYLSKTGTTKAAAEAMAKQFEAFGHTCTVESIRRATQEQLAQAELVCFGCWTAGLFILLQHPQKEYFKFLKGIGQLQRKKVVLFCTYKLAIGKMLEKMAAPLTAKGTDILGRFKFRGSIPDETFAAFARSLA